MPISFPSPPSASPSSSGYLSQPHPRPETSPDSALPKPSALHTLPTDPSPYDHLWTSSSSPLSPASTSTHPTEMMPPLSHPALDRTIQTLHGSYRELQHANRSELSQTRIAVERRMDDLAEAMHNDMRRLRDEALAEAATNHSDVFRCATTLGHVQDRLARLENAFNTLQDTLRSMHPAFASALPTSQPDLLHPTSLSRSSPVHQTH